MSGTAYITFTLAGESHEYDGGLPSVVLERVQHLLTPDGFWSGGYPRDLVRQAADEHDVLPIALWEIAHVGGKVLQIHGRRENGAIHEQDWKNPRIH